MGTRADWSQWPRVCPWLVRSPQRSDRRSSLPRGTPRGWQRPLERSSPAGLITAETNDRSSTVPTRSPLHCVGRHRSRARDGSPSALPRLPPYGERRGRSTLSPERRRCGSGLWGSESRSRCVAGLGMRPPRRSRRFRASEEPSAQGRGCSLRGGRSVGRGCGRPAWRRSTASWWRRTTISGSLKPSDFGRRSMICSRQRNAR